MNTQFSPHFGSARFYFETADKTPCLGVQFNIDNDATLYIGQQAIPAADANITSHHLKCLVKTSSDGVRAFLKKLVESAEFDLKNYPKKDALLRILKIQQPSQPGKVANSASINDASQMNITLWRPLHKFNPPEIMRILQTRTSESMTLADRGMGQLIDQYWQTHHPGESRALPPAVTEIQAQG